MIPSDVLIKFHDGLVKGEPDECWEFTGGSHNRKGWHRLISHRDKSGKRNFPAHRVAYELAFGEIPHGLSVLHRCDNPPCCNPAHLFLGTQSDNAKDMWKKQRGKPGSVKGMRLGPSPFRKFDGAVVVRMYKEGRTQRDIAEHFGCSDVAISAFLRKQHEVAHLVGRGGGAATKRKLAIKQRVLVLRKSGMSQRDVASALGISQAFVSKLERETE